MNESSEEFKVLKAEWHKRADDMTLDELPVFIEELNKCEHDYGTVCHAVALAGLATSQAMAKHHGITGFQAGCIMWEFIRGWQYSSNKTGLKLIDYDKMLYPQYAYHFDKTISKDTWEALQKEAAELVAKADEAYEKYLIDTDKYLVNLVHFVNKYPDYFGREDYYNHIGSGTYEEHAAYEEKVKSGFEFAPRKPYCPINATSPVYFHWISVAKGIVPFGYEVHEQ